MMTFALIKAGSPDTSFDFNGHERIMHQRHLTAETTELTERTSLDSPTDVRKCGSHTYTFPYANRHISCVSLSEGKLQNSSQ